jgi:hypothetical protein
MTIAFAAQDNWAATCSWRASLSRWAPSSKYRALQTISEMFYKLMGDVGVSGIGTIIIC